MQDNSGGKSKSHSMKTVAKVRENFGNNGLNGRCHLMVGSELLAAGEMSKVIAPRLLNGQHHRSKLNEVIEREAISSPVLRSRRNGETKLNPSHGSPKKSKRLSKGERTEIVQDR